MKALLRKHPRVKAVARDVTRQTLGRWSRASSSGSGELACKGGKPVRNTSLRPWPAHYEHNVAGWGQLKAEFFRIFGTGAEGLPQSRAQQFAGEWAGFCGCKYGLLLPHGTDALRIGLAAALDHDGLDYGGEIIVPNFSFIATATAALDRRFGLAFVDVDPHTLLIDPARVEEAVVRGKTRAIMPVHLFGQPADMTALSAIAESHGLKVIEDAAQAHGAEWNNRPVGSLGDVAGFSFQSFKNLSCGEGGALTTNSEEIFERAYSIHNAGRARIGGGRWEHLTLGWNCRPTEYQAALLQHRFRSFVAQQKVREKNFKLLTKYLKEVSCLRSLATHQAVTKHGTHMFVMRYDPRHCGGLSFEEFLRAVQAEGMPLYRAYEAPMSSQPVMRQLRDSRPEYFRLLPTPVAEQAANDTVYIPQHIFLGDESDMVEIVSAIRKVESYYANTSVSAGFKEVGSV
jgi:dTDP-4-amino-4,6-dideoxygalactose transaminase